MLEDAKSYKEETFLGSSTFGFPWHMRSCDSDRSGDRQHVAPTQVNS